MAAVVLLAGGTGGAKLAAGLQEIAGEDLTVIANTGDDIEIYGAYVSPDPDLITYWLAGTIDERGWGIAGDSFNVMEGLRSIGAEIWFKLGDRDLAICLERQRRLNEGARLSETLSELGKALGIKTRVFPVSDDPIRTQVKVDGSWLPFQEFMVHSRSEGVIEDVEFEGASEATPLAAALTAIASADAVVIGPSNPVASIGPILAVPGIRETLRSSPAPVIAVSPIVNGEVLKGPTAAFMATQGQPATTAGVAAIYGNLIDGLICDEAVPGVSTHICDLAMPDVATRRELAQQTLSFCERLSG